MFAFENDSDDVPLVVIDEFTLNNRFTIVPVPGAIEALPLLINVTCAFTAAGLLVSRLKAVLKLVVREVVFTEFNVSPTVLSYTSQNSTPPTALVLLLSNPTVTTFPLVPMYPDPSDTLSTAFGPVYVGVTLGVRLGDTVGVFVRLGVNVAVSVAVMVGVLLGTFVSVRLGVYVAVLLGVSEGVFVRVGVRLGVLLGTFVSVRLGVNVAVLLGV